MPDRTANWGESQSAAKYQTGDSDPAGGDFIVARKADGSAELLVWNDTAGQWESGGPVDMGGNDITNSGAISADALEASSIDIGNHPTINGIESGTTTADEPSAASDATWDTVEIADTTVNFDAEFDSVPQVIPDQVAEAGVLVLINNPTTTGFDIRLLNYSTSDYSGSQIDIDWVAIA